MVSLVISSVDALYYYILPYLESGGVRFFFITIKEKKKSEPYESDYLYNRIPMKCMQHVY